MSNGRKLCAYCGKWFDSEEMTPIYEENRVHVNHYCERCLPDVKFNISKLPWRKDLTVG